MREFYRKWLITALFHSPSIADLWSSLIGAILGVLAHFVPEAQSVVTDLVWQIPIWTFLVVFLVRLGSAPYWIFSQQETAREDAEGKLARISEDRPLSFNGLGLGPCIQHRPPYGHWIVERVELEFENMSDQRINWHFNQFYYEYLGSSVTIPLPEEGNKYCLLARETISYEFDVPGLQMQLKPLRVPTTVRFGFSINYDNVPRLKVRTTKRVLDCNIITLAPVEFYVNIVEQDEC